MLSKYLTFRTFLIYIERMKKQKQMCSEIVRLACPRDNDQDEPGFS